MCPIRPMASNLNQVGTHGTIHPESGMRYHSTLGVTLSVTLSRGWTAGSEHESGEMSGGC